jgi:dTDP-4-dehydrorhamnose reductase
VTIDLAIRAILAVIDDDDNGFYQFSAKGDISYFEAARRMAQMYGISEELIVETSAYKNEIFRYNSLDSTRIERLNIIPPDPFAILNDLV